MLFSFWGQDGSGSDAFCFDADGLHQDGGLAGFDLLFGQELGCQLLAEAHLFADRQGDVAGHTDVALQTQFLDLLLQSLKRLVGCVGGGLGGGVAVGEGDGEVDRQGGLLGWRGPAPLFDLYTGWFVRRQQ